MEKKATADADEASMCRKLFNVFVPAVKPDRRVTVTKQEPAAPPKVDVAGRTFMEEEEEEEKVIWIQSMERPPAEKLREKQRRSNSLNERAENYIARTKMKLRVGSAVGRHAS